MIVDDSQTITNYHNRLDGALESVCANLRSILDIHKTEGLKRTFCLAIAVPAFAAGQQFVSLPVGPYQVLPFTSSPVGLLCVTRSDVVTYSIL